MISHAQFLRDGVTIRGPVVVLLARSMHYLKRDLPRGIPQPNCGCKVARGVPLNPPPLFFFLCGCLACCMVAIVQEIETMATATPKTSQI